MKLNARQIETAKPKEKSYKLADGAGLYLEITPRGSKYWRMKYHRPTDRKEDRLAFGVYPAVSLADARANLRRRWISNAVQIHWSIFAVILLLPMKLTVC
ncbi:DUF4102 domain-containing protein [Xenorhabdus griffiniae]|nr:DUF4102 domain-containing protein [Xenorhabdus griffiniae]MBE8588760.1 DUF4102 domain-containing protein [Xenorhabdus griffiniae]